MTIEKEVKFYCYTEDEDNQGFDIYINDIKISDNLQFHENRSLSK